MRGLLHRIARRPAQTGPQPDEGEDAPQDLEPSIEVQAAPEERASAAEPDPAATAIATEVATHDRGPAEEAEDAPHDPPPPAARAQRASRRGERKRLARRLSDLSAVRDLQLLDLGGFVLDLYRFGRQRDDLVRAKLEALIESDRELDEIERQLDRKGSGREMRHRRVGQCTDCGTLYTRDSRFCRHCGTSLARSRGASAPGERPSDGGAFPQPPVGSSDDPPARDLLEPSQAHAQERPAQ